MLTGVAFSFLKWLDDEGAKQMTKLLLTVVTVCVIVKAFASVDSSAERVKEMLIAAGALFLTTLLGAVISYFVFRKKEIDVQVVLRYGTIFSNCGFIAIPLTAAILGDRGVFIVSIYMAVFQITTWTYGVSLCLKANKNSGYKKRNILLNAGVIGVAIGFLIFITGVKLPLILSEPVSGLASLNTPLAMIVTGFYLSKMAMEIKKDDLNILVGASIRLIVVPLLALGILYFSGVRGLPLVACVIPMCAPSASNTVMFAVEFGGDEVIASRYVSICTLFSLITMPVIISLAQNIS